MCCKGCCSIIFWISVIVCLAVVGGQFFLNGNAYALIRKGYHLAGPNYEACPEVKRDGIFQCKPCILDLRYADMLFDVTWEDDVCCQMCWDHAHRYTRGYKDEK
jgi:hypothetical protein